ncbi:MAG: L-ribulose-5-phosphate 4-epimerase AraD [Verrucomicrobiales bacterium]|nr:L-ribulose-5-phosphate 4-epimerase AraD [Verrucomicrobiales bacterium]
MLEELRQEICAANQLLESSGLVKLTFGNVSGIDRDQGVFGIKPSGVAYDDLTPEQIVLIDLDGKVVEGDLRPSSDTKTHLELYRAWPSIGGVTHTHSIHATSFAQAGHALPCLGTTHADHFYGEVPVCRPLTPEEVEQDYEAHTGLAIIEHFAQHHIDPTTMPAVLQQHHAPFTWGKNAMDSIKNSIALEVCAEMALATFQLQPNTEAIPAHILEKHHQRKHGANAYYGQAK